MEYATGQQLTRRQSTVWRALRAAAPQTIPVLAGYFVLGMGYGIYVQSLGLPVWMPMLMGTVVYGGSLEFVLASLLLSAFSPLSAFLMALMIQARHLFYGLAMLERYKGYGLRSFYMIFAMSDETFSITCSAEPPEGVDRGWFMFFITLLDQCYWVFSAGLGAVVGSVPSQRPSTRSTTPCPTGARPSAGSSTTPMMRSASTAGGGRAAGSRNTPRRWTA